jgi:hypothetical protein
LQTEEKAKSKPKRKSRWKPLGESLGESLDCVLSTSDKGDKDLGE